MAVPPFLIVLLFALLGACHGLEQQRLASAVTGARQALVSGGNLVEASRRSLPRRGGGEIMKGESVQ